MTFFTSRKSLVNLCFLFVCLIPLFYTAFLINKYSVNIFSVDDWQFVRYFSKLIEGNIATIFKEIFSTVNGHMFLGTNIILAPLAFLNVWDTKIPILIGWLFACLSILILTLIFITNSKTSQVYKVVFATLLSSLIYFSPAASENWMISIQMSIFFSIFCFITILGTLVFIKGDKAIAISAILSAISTFSYGFGFISYIVIYPIIVYLGFKLNHNNINQKNTQNQLLLIKELILSKYSIFWIFNFILIFAVYVFNVSKNINPISNLELVKISNNLILENLQKGFNFDKFIKFFFQITGAPLGLGYQRPYEISWFWGVIIIFIFIFCLGLLYKKRKEIELHNFLYLISLGFFSILANVVTSISRASMIPNQSLNPRYISASSLLIISIIFIILQINEQYLIKFFRRSKLILVTSIFLLVIAFYSYFLTYQAGLIMMQYISSLRLQSQACVSFIQECPDDFIERTFDLNLFHADYPIAQKLGMLPSSNVFEKNNTSKYGHFDGIEKSKTNLGEFEAWGWAISPSNDWTGTVVITKESSPKFVGLASANLPSPDLAEYITDRRYTQVRWRVLIPEEFLGVGQHTLKAWTFDSKSNKLIQIGKIHQITVKNQTSMR
ncbi:hypothetical protein [Anabaena sp. UHCC 0204]|uniref:hypothetical protein n=1 Tax=Anabaena sp. UHCC 0204 TaxID=2590009 RepID=UPI0014465BCD|nr:hypothetical protein [Anabaena sp. UHCC 0204]MTJ08639.1 hypothetical protein [Anabaena sp. UHCC 0204]